MDMISKEYCAGGTEEKEELICQTLSAVLSARFG